CFFVSTSSFMAASDGTALTNVRFVGTVFPEGYYWPYITLDSGTFFTTAGDSAAPGCPTCGQPNFGLFDSCPTTTTTTNPGSTTTTTVRFLDNGDGTVTDQQTGLQWEKKDTDPNSDPVPEDLHATNNRYAWAGCCDGTCQTDADRCQPNAEAAATCAAHADGGTAGCNTCTSGTCLTSGSVITTVWDWLNQLNAAGFAGHSDWRLPSQGRHSSTATGPNELESILTQGSCGGGIDPSFGPVSFLDYWSASTSDVPGNAWSVNGPGVESSSKDMDWTARAVR